MSCEASERGVGRRGYWDGPVGWSKSPHIEQHLLTDMGMASRARGQDFGFPSQRLGRNSYTVIAIYHMLQSFERCLQASCKAVVSSMFFSREHRDVSKEFETYNPCKVRPTSRSFYRPLSSLYMHPNFSSSPTQHQTPCSTCKITSIHPASYPRVSS